MDVLTSRLRSAKKQGVAAHCPDSLFLATCVAICGNGAITDIQSNTGSYRIAGDSRWRQRHALSICPKILCVSLTIQRGRYNRNRIFG